MPRHFRTPPVRTSQRTLRFSREPGPALWFSRRPPLSDPRLSSRGLYTTNQGTATWRRRPACGLRTWLQPGYFTLHALVSQVLGP